MQNKPLSYQTVIYTSRSKSFWIFLGCLAFVATASGLLYLAIKGQIDSLMVYPISIICILIFGAGMLAGLFRILIKKNAIVISKDGVRYDASFFGGTGIVIPWSNIKNIHEHSIEGDPGLVSVKDSSVAIELVDLNKLFSTLSDTKTMLLKEIYQAVTKQDEFPVLLYTNDLAISNERLLQLLVAYWQMYGGATQEQVMRSGVSTNIVINDQRGKYGGSLLAAGLISNNLSLVLQIILIPILLPYSFQFHPFWTGIFLAMGVLSNVFIYFINKLQTSAHTRSIIMMASLCLMPIAYLFILSKFLPFPKAGEAISVEPILALVSLFVNFIGFWIIEKIAHLLKTGDDIGAMVDIVRK
jgi:hypothetical protein